MQYPHCRYTEVRRTNFILVFHCEVRYKTTANYLKNVFTKQLMNWDSLQRKAASRFRDSSEEKIDWSVNSVSHSPLVTQKQAQNRYTGFSVPKHILINKANKSIYILEQDSLVLLSKLEFKIDTFLVINKGKSTSMDFCCSPAMPLRFWNIARCAADSDGATPACSWASLFAVVLINSIAAWRTLNWRATAISTGRNTDRMCDRFLPSQVFKNFHQIFVQKSKRTLSVRTKTLDFEEAI